MAKNVLDIKKLLAEKMLVCGTERTKKLLMQKKLAKVLLSSNVSPVLRTGIARMAAASGAEIVELPENNEELGVLCKKPFAVAVVGVSKSK